MSSQYQNVPQGFLDEIHHADIPALFLPQTSRARKETLVESKKKLNTIIQHIRQQQDSIRGQYKKQKKKNEQATRQEQLELAPFNLLEELGNTLNTRVRELEKAMDQGKMLPEGFEIDELIFGDEKTGEWFLGSSQDSERWNETQTIKRRLDDYHDQQKPFDARIQVVKDEMLTLKEKMDATKAKIVKGERPGATRLRAAFIFIMAILIGALAAYLYLVQEVEIGIALAVGVFSLALILYIPIMQRHHQRSMGHLRQDIEAWRVEMKQLQQKGKAIQQEAAPVKRAIKGLEAQYQELRATFG